MKKLMIAAAIVCAAVASQAAQFKWSTSAKFYGVSANAVDGNGNYSASTATADRGDKTGNSFTYILTVYDSGKTTVAGSATGSLAYSLGKVDTTITVDNLIAGTTYDYVLKVTGTQNSLTTKTSSDYNYSNAELSYEFTKGSVTVPSMGIESLSLGVPTTWTVSGITPVEPPEPTPEPTSAMLMLLGVAGLALRRKRA